MCRTISCPSSVRLPSAKREVLSVFGDDYPTPDGYRRARLPARGRSRDRPFLRAIEALQQAEGLLTVNPDRLRLFGPEMLRAFAEASGRPVPRTGSRRGGRATSRSAMPIRRRPRSN